MISPAFQLKIPIICEVLVAGIFDLVGFIQEHGIAAETDRQVLHFLKETIAKIDEVIHEINDIARLD